MDKFLKNQVSGNNPLPNATDRLAKLKPDKVYLTYKNIPPVNFIEVQSKSLKDAIEKTNAHLKSAGLENLVNEKSTNNSTDLLEEELKILKIAMRIMRGDIVPPQDESFLAERNPKLYLTVKLAAQNKEDPVEHDSILKEEDDPIKDLRASTDKTMSVVTKLITEQVSEPLPEE